VKDHHTGVSLGTLCGLFGISRQAHYKSLERSSKKNLWEHLVLNRVDEIRNEQPRIGGKKLHHMLKDELESQEMKIGRDQFFKLLRANNKLVKPRRNGIRTTYSYRWYNRFDNLIQDIKPEAPNEVWVSDITYVRVMKGFVYLSLITDANSRRIVGYHLSNTLSTDGCVKALKMALNGCPEPSGIIHHSDRGVQYCSKQYTSILEENNMLISMTQPDSPLDNPIAERVNGIIKQEFIDNYYLTGIRDTRQVLSRAVEIYNSKRPHLSLKMETPNQVHFKDHM
jgi:putative transposase